jgi:hypothetical protein
MRKYLLGLSILVCLAIVVGLGLKVRSARQAGTTAVAAGTRTASFLKLTSSPFAPAVKTAATPAKTLPASATTAAKTPVSTSASTQTAVAAQYGKLPLSFEPNVGQTDPQAKYMARGDGYTLFLTSDEAVLSLVGHKNKQKPDHRAPRGHRPAHSKTKKPHGRIVNGNSNDAGILRMELAGANPSPTFSAQDQLPGITNYFIGKPENWHANVPTYRRVSEQDVYPGIDLVYYGSQRQLEYDFVVAPNADPRAIRLSVSGATKLSTSAQGDLQVAMAGGEVAFRKPVAYQWKNGEKQIVAANFKLQGTHDVTFALGNYDASQPLVIDPILAYSTYLGGSDIDGANAIAVASDNTAFIAGGTSSTDFPTAHALQPNDGGSNDFPQDAFVTKFSADGSTLFYSTYLGGSNNDVANGIAVDTAGDAYVVGTTDSPNFPVTFGSVNPLCGGDGECGASLNTNGLLVENGFIVKLNPAGSTILYGSFIGEYENVTSLGVAVDANQVAYVTGSVSPYIIPTKASTAAGITISGVVENGAGTQATYTTTAANGFVINQYVTVSGISNNAFNGSFFIVGITSPTSFVVNVAAAPGATSAAPAGSTASVVQGPLPFCYDPNAAQIFYGGGATDAYVFTISATGDSQLYCTFLGGGAEDVGNGIAVDNSSDAYVTGLTYSTDFPTTASASQAAYGGAGDAFLTEVNANPPSKLPFVYSTHLGGIQLDQGNGIALFETASKTYLAFIAGGTSSTGLATAGAFQSNCTLDPQGNCEGDAFVAEFNTALSGTASEVFFTYLGGSLNDSASGVALDPSGNIYVTGSTVSTDFVPASVATTAFQPTYGGGNDDAFVAKFDPTGATLLYASYLGGSNTDNGHGIAVDTSGSAYVAGQTCSLDFPLANAEQPVAGGDCDAFVSKISILNGIELNPGGLTFPPQSLDTTSAPETVTLTNGESTTTISSVSITGPNATDFAETTTCPASIQPDTQCTFSVTFTPQANGLRKAFITINDSAPGTPHMVPLTGSTSALMLSVSSLSFGNEGVGETAPAQSVVATNVGTAPITFSSILASGAFSETDNCTAPIQPGTNCTINVVFTPATAGATTGALTLNDSAPGSPQIVQLTGTGVNSTLVLSPSPLAFMTSETVGVASAPMAITAMNSGTTPITISSITASGAFSETNNCLVALQPGTNCAINVVFTPTATGAATGALTVTDNAPFSPQIVQLSGTGITSTLSLSSATLAFGNQAVGVASPSMPIVATNVGTTPITISSILASGAFSQTNNCTVALQPNTNCTINVVFTPTAAGPDAGALTIADNGTASPQIVQLSGTGSTLTLALSTTSLTFATQAVGTSSSAMPVIATNTGTSPLTISSIVASGAFSQTNTCTAALSAGASCTISVVFTPAAAGTSTGALTLTDNALGSPQTVQLSGTGTTSALALSPASLSFGNQAVGTTSTPSPVTVMNTGTSPLTFSSITASGAFAETNNCGASIPASTSCTVNVTFTPTAGGATTGALTFIDNAPASPQLLQLTGTGTAATAAITLSPTSLAFGNQAVGTTSPASPVTVTNTGTSPLTISSIAASGAFSETNNCGTSIPASTSCTVNVTFTPTAGGATTGAVTFVDNAPSSPQLLPLTGTGTASTAAITLSPASLSFGNEAVGSTSTALTITATNTGSSLLNFTSIIASGAFSQTNNCGASIPAGTNCTINVTFTPTASGAAVGAVSFTDNAPASPQAVSLSGTGVTSTLALSPASLAFNTQSVGVASNPQAITATNTGSTVITISSIVASGAFSETNNCQVPLQPNTNCTINVVFTPTATGAAAGALTITDNAPFSPQIVQLSGNGSNSILSLSTNMLAFGDQAVGSPSNPMAVTATNTGATPLTFSGIVTSGAFSETNNCASSIPANTSCTVNVVFTPTTQGPTTGALTFTDNAPGSPQTVQLSGTGIVSTLTLSTFSLAFGNQNVGVASAPQAITATNNGAATLTFSSIQASGAFSETDNCAVPLKPGTSCTINVVFTPTTAGATTGAVTLTDNAPGSPQTVQLTGTGISPTPDFTIQSTPGSATISAGSYATFTLLLSALNGFDQPVQLSATGVPPNATLEVSVNPVTPGTTAPAQVTLTVKTGARTMLPGGPRSTHPSRPLRPMIFTLLLWLACLMAAGIILTTMSGKMQGQRATIALVFMVMLIMLSAACNGGAQVGSIPGTPAGNYQITITGTSTGATHATVIDLQVN